MLDFIILPLLSRQVYNSVGGQLPQGELEGAVFIAEFSADPLGQFAWIGGGLFCVFAGSEGNVETQLFIGSF
ncbi:MAG: hypothetical protein FJW20_19400 [Acidimicrobiia bacterium]|nr:hypothetical protein [Acidimicrobiia bacterium]